jgi:hypothetical protein
MASSLARLVLSAAFVAWPIVVAGQASSAAQAEVPASPPPVSQGPAAASQADAEGSAAEASARYRALVDRVKGADPSVDLAELREAYTLTPDYRAMMMGVYQQLWRPLGSGDFPAALKVAESVLERNYVEINAHMVASFAHQQLGNPARAAHHRAVADGLLRVIMAGGDGKTAETAWAVIDISEEYAVMRALNVTMKSQGLQMNPKGPSLDVLRVIDNRTKEERTLYFNVDRSMAAMTRPK